MSIRLAVTPDSRWEIGVDALVAAVRAAGFAGLGSPVSWVSAAARGAYDAAGLACHEIMALVISDDVARTVAYAERLAVAAQTMAAPWINTVFQAAARLTIESRIFFNAAGSGCHMPPAAKQWSRSMWR